MKQLTIELKVLRIKGGDSRLVLRVVLYGARMIASVSACIARRTRRTHVGREVWVLESLVHGQSLLRVECLRGTSQRVRKARRARSVRTNVLDRKSNASGVAFGNTVLKDFRFLMGSARM